MADTRPAGATAPHASDVFSQLPSLLMRALDTPEVMAVVHSLVQAGWRPGQLRHRVGSAPSQGTVEGDAAAVRLLLRGLADSVPPDVAHARAWAQRRQDLAEQAEQSMATPEVRDRYVAQIRAGLRGPPRARPSAEPRTRPACNLCDGEGVFFVTHEVHLCRRCVAVIAAGEARLAGDGLGATG